MAFDILKSRYPNDVECRIEGQLPLKKYLEVMRETNVNVDQIYSYSYGMNALYSMAYSQIVVTGAEAECNGELEVENSPIVNASPNLECLIQQLEKIVQERNNIEDIGEATREYVERNHAAEKIAEKYMNTWLKN